MCHLKNDADNSCAGVRLGIVYCHAVAEVIDGAVAAKVRPCLSRSRPQSTAAAEVVASAAEVIERAVAAEVVAAPVEVAEGVVAAEVVAAPVEVTEGEDEGTRAVDADAGEYLRGDWIQRCEDAVVGNRALRNGDDHDCHGTQP